jgi:hypothetical protein
MYSVEHFHIAASCPKVLTEWQDMANTHTKAINRFLETVYHLLVPSDGSNFFLSEKGLKSRPKYGENNGE